jgi:hypothetical protein
MAGNHNIGIENKITISYWLIWTSYRGNIILVIIPRIYSILNDLNNKNIKFDTAKWNVKKYRIMVMYYNVKYACSWKYMYEIYVAVLYGPNNYVF